MADPRDAVRVALGIWAEGIFSPRVNARQREAIELFESGQLSLSAATRRAGASYSGVKRIARERGAVLRRGRIVPMTRREQMLEAALRYARPFQFSVQGAVYFYNGDRSYDREHDIPAQGMQTIGETDIVDAPTGDFRVLLREGLEESAVDALIETMFIAYGIEGSEFNSVDGVTFQ